MTTPESAPKASADDTLDTTMAPERRLHPMSWLFVLLQQLRQFILPLLALFFFGSGDRNDLWGLVAICVLVAISIWRYYTYRFRIGADSLQIRSGVLERSLREIPFSRINNVALHQSLLHRIFGVAEVRLESAGGVKPEAEMRVLKLDDAMALEALVRRRHTAHAAAGPATPEGALASDDGHLLLRLSPGDILRVGLLSNRGLVIVGGAYASMMQFNRQLMSNLMERWGRSLFGAVDEYSRGHEALIVVTLIIGFIVLLRLFSVVLAVLQYAGFRLEEHGRRLTLERGLLSRMRTSAPRRRIQSWTLREGVLHRLLKRRTLEVSTAVIESGSENQARSLRELAPVATPDQCDAMIRHLLPQAQWPMPHWHPLHRSALWRRVAPHWLLAAAAAAAAGFASGWLGAAICLWLPWSAYLGWQHVRHAGHAVDDTLVAMRGGWWTRTWHFAEIGKLQAIRIGRSPLDRWFGTASLLLDTAGGHAIGGALRLHCLPVAEAQALHARLAHEIARSKMRW